MNYKKIIIYLLYYNISRIFFYKFYKLYKFGARLKHSSIIRDVWPPCVQLCGRVFVCLHYKNAMLLSISIECTTYFTFLWRTCLIINFLLLFYSTPVALKEKINLVIKFFLYTVYLLKTPLSYISSRFS